MPEPQFVALLQEKDVFEIALFDSDRNRIGHGYRGPSKSRADQDLKYWTRTKGLQLVESGSDSVGEGAP